MNENPEGTPNPLSQGSNLGPDPNDGTLDANPAEPVAPGPTPVADEMSEFGGAEPVPPAGQPMVQPANQINSLDPTGRPMEQAAPVVEQPKKKKTGLIVGVIIAVLALIGVGIAIAVAVTNMNRTDAVAVAMQKLMNGETAANVGVDGTIDIAVNDPTSPISQIFIKLDSNLIASSLINASTATLTVTTRSGDSFDVEFKEVYAANGDLYFKIDGATAMLEDSGLLNALNSGQTTNCDAAGENCVEEPVIVEDCAAGETDCMTVTTVEGVELTDGAEVVDGEIVETNTVTGGVDLATLNLLAQVMEVVDGEWLKISTDELGAMAGGVANSSKVSCLTNLVSDVNKNSNSTIELYNKYPFVSSTTDGVTIASKVNPVYRVVIDGANLVNFINSIQNAEMASNLYSCLGLADNVSIDATEAAELANGMPTLYTEVSSDGYFTRLYLVTDIYDGTATATIDLTFNYPSAVNVTEPAEYQNFSDIIQEIMSAMFLNVENAVPVN